MLTSEIKMLLPFIEWSGGPAEIKCPLVQDKGHRALLSLHNGLTAFNGGLRVFGTSPGVLPTVQDWNRSESWRSEYKELVSKDLIFFAEDVFGNQVAFHGEGIVYFTAETGRSTPFANSFSEWLSIILDDPVDTLQLIFFNAWTAKRELLEPSEHLCPVYPFIVKSDPPLKELYRVSSAEDMSYKGSFAYQIKDVPDGTQIKIRVTD